jgi:voltage-gated potassium channel
MGPHKRVFLAVCFLLFFLATGTAGYHFLEGYSFIDAFYMTVITISTVGYGEINPLSENGRIFTVFLILSGVGSIAFAASAFTEMVIERAANPNRWMKSMEKKISKLKGHVIICGHGRVGAAAAEYFSEKGADFVIIENSDETTKKIAELGFFHIPGDGTREDVLLKAGIKKASALLAVLDSDPDNLFAVLTARELNPVLKIIARIDLPSSESRILRAGADSVISPFAAAGQKVAESLLAKEDLENDLFFGGSGKICEPRWQEVTEDSELIGKNISAAAQLISGKIIGIRRSDTDILMPEEDDPVKVGDYLLVLETSQKPLNKKVETHLKKVVLIDDNPVILRLYTRLFQKAGFNTLCAATGKAGYDLILEETPDVAVIDYRLPDMSGLSICRNVRRLEDKDDVKLVLFTADDREETRMKAIEAGVDRVVVKSPNAGEIVSLVADVM